MPSGIAGGTRVEINLEAFEAFWEQPEPLRERLAAAGADEKLTRALVRQLEQDLKTREEYQAFAKQLLEAGANDRAKLNRAFHDLLWKWFERKLVVIPDYYATGDQIVDRVCEETPPSFRNRIQGIQNIKGTGLDFVYRWEAWNTCYQACALLRSDNPGQFVQGLQELSTFHDYGLLSEEHVRATIEAVRHSPVAQREQYQAQLNLISANLDTKMREVHERVSRSTQKGGLLIKVCAALEAFLDAGDAVKRRKTANQLYKDLAAERISHQRAALELQELNKRQKGGWFLRKVENFRDYLTRKQVDLDREMPIP